MPIDMPSTWWEWVLLLLAGIFGIFLVRLSVTLDLNSVLKDRKDRQLSRLQNACTHLQIEPLEVGRLRVTPLFYSPPGTMANYCSRCNVSSFDPERDYSTRFEYFISNIQEYQEAEKQFGKLLKKSGYV